MKRGRLIFRRIIFSLFLLALIAVASLFAITTLYQEELKELFITSMNERLNTPVQVENMEVSAFAHFPQISLLLNNVTVQSSLNATDTLLYAQRIDFSVNALSVLFGEISFDQVTLKQAQCTLYTNPRGEINYDIFNAPADTTKKSALDLSRISLLDVDFTYVHDPKELRIEAFAKDLNASLAIDGMLYDVWADGIVDVHKVSNRKIELVSELHTRITTELEYNNATRFIKILPSIIRPNDKIVQVEGTYDFGSDEPEISVTAKSESLETSALLALLPSSLRSTGQSYDPDGEIAFSMAYSGKYTNNTGPEFSSTFRLQNVAFTHKETGERLSRIQGDGKLGFTNSNDISTGSISLSNIVAELDDQPLKGSFSLKNFSVPWLQFQAQGSLRVQKVLQFYPLPSIEKGEGNMLFNMSYSGALKQLKNAQVKDLTATGTLELEDLALHLTNIDPHFNQVQAVLHFDNNNVQIEKLTGDFGNSDFELKGEFKNALNYLIHQDQKIGVEASLKSELIDLDELLSLNPSSGKAPYSFYISPFLQAHLDCDIQELKFRRFHPKEISGDFKIRNQVAFSDKLTLSAMGGKMDLLGMADASRDDLVRISANATFNHIAVDSVFFVFENFGQTFLEDRHLKGFLNADVGTSMILSNHLKLYPETLRSGISVSIQDGELNNFTPLMKLAPYLDEAELQHLRFSELRNDILIKDKTIFLPPMEVSSNATDLTISGTHTFSQRINYQVKAPLIHTVKNDSDERFGAIEKDASGRSMLFLQITGSTSEYYVSLDRKTVKDKIARDLKKEKEELKEIFKNKGKVSEEVELSEEDYFEWEDDGSDSGH